MTNTPVWIIFWHYSDNSGWGVVQAFSSKEDAQAALKILNDVAGNYKMFELVETEIKQ